MRQLFLDTETTGLSAEGGDRVIELGCVELVNRKLTGNNLHFYFNPGRDSHEDALKVHGISNEFLRDKPKFGQIVDELLEYLRKEGKYANGVPCPRPSLILLDLNMPRMDGREALHNIKNDDNLRGIPIVILTTSKQEEDMVRGYNLGAASYITKPVNFDGLVELMRTLGKYWVEFVELPVQDND